MAPKHAYLHPLQVQLFFAWNVLICTDNLSFAWAKCTEMYWFFFLNSGHPDYPFNDGYLIGHKSDRVPKMDLKVAQWIFKPLGKQHSHHFCRCFKVLRSDFWYHPLQNAIDYYFFNIFLTLHFFTTPSPTYQDLWECPGYFLQNACLFEGLVLFSWKILIKS